MKIHSLILFLCLALTLRADDSSQGKKIMVTQGNPTADSLTASDKFPPLEGRPADLRPESLPRGIRYKFTDDAAVVAAAKLISEHLLAMTKPEGQLFSGSVIVNAGAWKAVKSHVTHPKTPVVINAVRMGSKVLKLEMAFFQNQDEIISLEKVLAEIVKEDGGGRVRALKTSEMKKWWTFIAFDISEPTIVLETKNMAHVFILDVGKDGLVVSVDELNGLPN